VAGKETVELPVAVGGRSMLTTDGGVASSRTVRVIGVDWLPATSVPITVVVK